MISSYWFKCDANYLILDSRRYNRLDGFEVYCHQQHDKKTMYIHTVDVLQASIVYVDISQ